MSISVPQALIYKINKTLEKMGGYKAIEGFRWQIGAFGDEAARRDFDDSSWNYTEKGLPFKRDQGETWFRFTVKTPENLMGIPIAGTMLRLGYLFFAPTDIYINGELRFSESAWMDFKSPEVVLTQNAVPDESFLVAVKLGLGSNCFWNLGFGMAFIPEVLEDAEFEISSFREELKFACRFESVEDILPQVFTKLEVAIGNPCSIPLLLEVIGECRGLLRPMEAEAKEQKVHLVGHAHIDMNWFWSMEETIRVIGRDFTTMCDILAENPEFRFSQSQCQTYKIAEELYPDIFKKIKKYVDEGRWDITASTWVEGDLNMASGESIVRHILYSKKYIKERFGIEPHIMWCPDTFGHSANIPQILKKSGINNYFFLRCGPDFEKTHHDGESFIRDGEHYPVFWWEGMDGSRVLAVNMPYGADVWTAGLIAVSNRMKDAFELDRAMFVYGTGDHGGGPTRRDVRRAKKLASYPTMPDIKFSTTEEFYSEIHNNKDDLPLLPVRKGELNFIFDGCYTTHADIKRYNRQCENTLFAAEILSSAAALHGMGYRAEELESAWQATLFNQFHDILDGSGVPATYRYSAEIAEKTLNTLQDIIADSMDYIGQRMRARRIGLPVLCVNPTGWERSGYVRIKKPSDNTSHYAVSDGDGNTLPSQTIGGNIYVLVKNIPATGGKTIYVEQAADIMDNTAGTIADKGEYFQIDTHYYQIELKKASGEIVTLYDKKSCHYVVRRGIICWRNRNGVLNTLSVHNEEPTHMAAWTIGNITSARYLVDGARAEIIADGPEIKIIRFTHQFNTSLIKQDVIIYNDSPRIDFETEVDWNEYGDRDKDAPMLRVSFVPDVKNSAAVYEIPFGTVERYCRDAELPALKWIDISDGENGFALLNDCKHGHKVRGNTIELALIRSSWMPDPKSDTGHHRFTYSIVPHSGELKETALKEGWFLNNEMISAYIHPQGNEPDSFSLVHPSCGNVVVSAVKYAEDGEGMIMRVYESCGDACRVGLAIGFPFKTAIEVDLNEKPLDCFPIVSGNEIVFDIGAYDVRTFKIQVNEGKQ